MRWLLGGSCKGRVYERLYHTALMHVPCWCARDRTGHILGLSALTCVLVVEGQTHSPESLTLAVADVRQGPYFARPQAAGDRRRRRGEGRVREARGGARGGGAACAGRRAGGARESVRGADPPPSLLAPA